MGNHIKFEDEISFPASTQEFVKDLKTAIRLRSEAKLMIAEGKEMEARANQLAKVAMPILGVDKVMTNLGGLTMVKESETKTVDNDGVKKYFLDKGVSATMVAAAYRNNTKVGSKAAYVKFVKPK